MTKTRYYIQWRRVYKSVDEWALGGDARLEEIGNWFKDSSEAKKQLRNLRRRQPNREFRLVEVTTTTTPLDD